MEFTRNVLDSVHFETKVCGSEATAVHLLNFNSLIQEFESQRICEFETIFGITHSHLRTNV